MDKKTKIIFKVSLILILGMIAIGYYKIFILQDYKISIETTCDPTVENCFVGECDPELTEDCNSEDSGIYYKLMERKAYNVPDCTNDDSPECLLCKENEDNCKIITCDPSIPENICSNPQQ